MRPDEHKKKKSAAYKKKHGIGNKVPSATDNATLPDDKKAKKEHRLKQQSESHGPGHHPDHASNSNLKNVKNVTKMHVSDESSESDTEVVEKKSFRRREVVSNWRKYDLEPENEGTVTSKGENFEKLLTMAGEAMSRFRFKDELEWEEDMIRVGDGDRTDEILGGSGVFGVDLAETSSSMSCIPIHRLLGIDQSLFPTDQLESHLQTVTRNRNIYNNTIRQKEEQSKYRTCEMSKDSHIVSNDLEHTSSSSHSQSVHRISEVIEKHKDNEKGVRQVSETLQADNTKECPVNEIVTDRTANGVETLSGDSMNGKQKSQIEPSISLQDGDLDQLLDMEIMGQEKDIGKEDNTVKSDNVREISNEKKDAANKEADELEDWLDSILD